MRRVNIKLAGGLVLLAFGVVLGLLNFGQSAPPAGALAAITQEVETPPTTLPVFSSQVINYGAYGDDVYELQGRLSYLGFYYGKLDSVFGSKTRDSLKWFQSEFGMKVDGLAGPQTKLKLYNATKAWKPGENNTAGSGNNGSQNKEADKSKPKETPLSGSNSLGLSDNDLKIMANAVYGESRGEPFEGQVAVAAVIINRVKSPSFPNTASGVIFQPGAFTAVADGQIYLEPNESARKAVQQALNGWDPSDGCLYYFNPETATSKWIWTRPQVKTIGKHIFCM